MHANLPSPGPSVSTSRRGLLRAGAWTLPVITVVAAAPAFATSGSGAITAAQLVADKVGMSIDTQLIQVTNGGGGVIPRGELLLDFGNRVGVEYDKANIGSQGPWTLLRVGMTALFQYDADISPGTQVLPNVSAPLSMANPGFLNLSLQWQSRISAFASVYWS